MILPTKHGNLEDIKKYRDTNAFSYSFLKNVLNNDIKGFKGSLAASMGSAIDCLLFCPNDFNNLFYVEDVKRPGGDLVDIIEKEFEKTGQWNESRLLQEARNKNYGNGKNNDDIIIEKFNKLKYWYDVLELRGTKEFITEQEYNSAKYWSDKLKRDNPSKDLISKGLFQVPHFTNLQFNVDGVNYDVPCKALPDILIFNFKFNKLDHICMYDLKCTTYGYEYWKDKVVNESRLLIQQSFYHDILQKIYNVPIKCHWLVCSYSSKKIVIYPTDPDDIEIGREGCRIITSHTYTPTFDKRKEHYIHGYKDAIVMYDQCIKLKLPDYDLKYHTCGGVFESKSIFE